MKSDLHLILDFLLLRLSQTSGEPEMTKAWFYLIIANIYLAISLRDKPVTISILSLCYFVLCVISMGN